MLGERSEQRGLWEADRLYIDHVGRGSFYGLLASMRGQLFEDEEFAELYCADNGRDSVPPSLLSTALLLQTHDRVSDARGQAEGGLRHTLERGAGYRSGRQAVRQEYASAVPSASDIA